MSILVAILIFLTLLLLYHRHMPILGIGKMNINYVSYNKDTILVDTRDYQTSCSDSKEDAYCIPLAYLGRHATELPTNKNIIIVASDRIEKNLSARILRKKGLPVIGYNLTNDVGKERFNYEVRCSSEK